MQPGEKSSTEECTIDTTSYQNHNQSLKKFAINHKLWTLNDILLGDLLVDLHINMKQLTVLKVTNL